MLTVHRCNTENPMHLWNIFQQIADAFNAFSSTVLGYKLYKDSGPYRRRSTQIEGVLRLDPSARFQTLLMSVKVPDFIDSFQSFLVSDFSVATKHLRVLRLDPSRRFQTLLMSVKVSDFIDSFQSFLVSDFSVTTKHLRILRLDPSTKFQTLLIVFRGFGFRLWCCQKTSTCFATRFICKVSECTDEKNIATKFAPRT